MSSFYYQPDPHTCVPTALAYLLYKNNNDSFEGLLQKFVWASYKEFDVAKDGMSFEQMQKVAKDFGIDMVISSEKPEQKPYLTGVTKLPLRSFEKTELIINAIKENSLSLTNDFFVYPYGHAVVVFPKNSEESLVFDSLLGKEISVKNSVLEENLETPVSYFFLK